MVVSIHQLEPGDTLLDGRVVLMVAPIWEQLPSGRREITSYVIFCVFGGNEAVGAGTQVGIKDKE